MLTVTLYKRQDCPLCQKAEDDLNDLQEQIPHRLVLIDVEQEGISKYIDKIPVIEVGPYQINAPIEKKTIQMTLGAANDRIQQLDNIQIDNHQKRIKRGKEISFGLSATGNTFEERFFLRKDDYNNSVEELDKEEYWLVNGLLYYQTEAFGVGILWVVISVIFFTIFVLRVIY